MTTIPDARPLVSGFTPRLPFTDEAWIMELAAERHYTDGFRAGAAGRPETGNPYYPQVEKADRARYGRWADGWSAGVAALARRRAPCPAGGPHTGGMAGPDIPVPPPKQILF